MNSSVPSGKRTRLSLPGTRPTSRWDYTARVASQLPVAAHFALVLPGYQVMNTRCCVGIRHAGSASRSRLVSLPNGMADDKATNPGAAVKRTV